ncbi:corrinoid protein [Calditrichota bacterium]
MELLQQISENLQAGDDEKIKTLVTEAIDQKIPAKDILYNGLIPAMNIVGKKFKNNEIFLPEVLLSARAMTGGMELLKPLFIKEDVPTIGKIVIGTIHGDLHDIGKNLVAIMLKGAGFEVIDLGRDVAPEKFVQTAQEENAQVIGMSALLTTTMLGMKKVTYLLKQNGLDSKIKTVIGGAPVTEKYALEIGADGYAGDAASAVECVKKVIGAV